MPVEKPTETRISLLEREISTINSSLIEIKSSAEKHREAHNQVTEKIYNRMDDLREEVKSDINKLKLDFDLSINKQNEILADIHSKILDLDKWRWIVVGAAGILGFILSKLTNFFGYSIIH